MLKAYKYRLYPNKEQKILLEKHFGCVRLVYNKALELKKSVYESENKTLSRFDLIKELPKWRKTDELSFLNEVSIKSLEYSVKNLDNAYKKFFKEKKGFPKFKSKYNKKDSFTTEGCKVYFKENKIQISKFKEGIKAKINRSFEGKIKFCTIKKTKTDKYYAFVLVDDGKDLPNKKKATEQTTIGIDLGIKTLAICSNGETLKNDKLLEKALKKISNLQRKQSKKVKGSHRYKDLQRTINRTYEKVVNKRKDNINKFTTSLVNNDKINAICIEDLDVKDMLQNKNLAKNIQSACFSEIRRQLEYKCEWNGKNLEVVDRFFASSKTCSHCGYINTDLELKDRTWKCPNCNTIHDRDFNASINIKNEGFKNLTNK